MWRVVLSRQVQVRRLVGVNRRVVRVEGVQVCDWVVDGFVVLVVWEEMLELWDRRDEMSWLWSWLWEGKDKMRWGVEGELYLSSFSFVKVMWTRENSRVFLEAS
jgi:hypothetical protein